MASTNNWSPWVVVLSWALCPGCTADKGEDDTVESCASDTLLLSDANNYTFSGALTLPSIETAEHSDLQICWDEVTQDIQCHDVDPALDIDNVGLVRFGSLSHADVEAGLSNNDLQQSDTSGYVAVENDGGTCTTLSAMTLFGTEVDVISEYAEESGTYMLLLTTGTTPGVGARMISFLTPTPSSSNTEVSVPGGCGVLDFEVDLDGSETARVCETTALPVDWSAVAHDGQGNSLDTSQIDLLTLGFYEGMSVATLEEDFLDLELIATATYSLTLEGGTTADLSLAMNGDVPFPGFEGDGLWVLALRSTRASNPAPLFLTLIEAGGGA